MQRDHGAHVPFTVVDAIMNLDFGLKGPTNPWWLEVVVSECWEP